MMRPFSLFVIPVALLAQSTTTSYQTGINGERVPTSSQSTSATGTRSQNIKSTSGSPIPAVQETEKILRDDASGKVIERTIQHYDANGRPARTERITIEETPLPGGGKTSTETRAQSDLNGRYSPTERRTTETRVNGLTTTTSVTVDRPTPNNSFQTAEKRSIVAVGPKDKQTTTETVERLGITGRFQPVQRTETSVQVAGDKTVQNTAVYDLNVVGKFGLSQQTVATTTKGPNGETTETNIYGTETLGRSGAQSDKLQLQQQLMTQKKVAADGSVTEVVMARSPNPSDPTKLGDPQQISETVCTGKCVPTPAAATPAKPPAPKVIAAPKP
ncbi:MAG: hypothetical protein ABIR70_24600 [Bryobacteraceae bacterium]